ncbi:hypothetical protein HDU67_007246, partial [Dinochytrium kinnereticum]
MASSILAQHHHNPLANCRPLPFHQAVASREILPSRPRINISKRHFVKGFVSSEFDQYKVLSEQGAQIPPFACAYNNIANDGKYLAIADEEGTIGVIDTTRDNRSETGEEPILIFPFKRIEDTPRVSWQAHQNAIFDICWTPDDKFMVTAAGDQTCRLWDVERQECVCVFAGHECSVKSVSYNPKDPNVFATAARDGNIMIWDVRCTGKVVGDAYHHRAVDVIPNAHINRSAPQRGKRRSLLVTQSCGVTA